MVHGGWGSGAWVEGQASFREEEIAIRRGLPEKAARMTEDTGRGLKGRKGPAEEETQASPQGGGNPRA